MWTLRVAVIALAVCAAPACSGGATPTQPTETPVASYLPVPPPALSAGSPPPNYAGVWVGQFRNTDCRSSIAGFCRIIPVPQEVTLRLNQIDITVTGTMSVTGTLVDSLLRGYIAEDGAIFSPVSDSGFRLERAGDVLDGMKVTDTYRNSVLIRSEKHEFTDLRRVQ